MAEVLYLTLLDVEALHDYIMRKTGQPPSGIRDRALLESALMRAQAAAHYVHADLIRQCALLAIGISQAQAFVDGNKRTAFVVADVFLRLNGHLFTGDPLEMANKLETVAMSSRDSGEAVRDFASWLRPFVTCQHPPAGTAQ